MYLLKHDRTEVSEQLTKKWGEFNYFPPLWKDVTSDPQQVEIVKRHLCDLNFQAAEYRQMHYPEELKSDGYYVAATLFFTRSENGFALGKVYNRNTFKFEDRYYVFGCQHTKCRSQNIGRCWNAYTCQDCGYYWTVDSSD